MLTRAKNGHDPAMGKCQKSRRKCHGPLLCKLIKCFVYPLESVSWALVPPKSSGNRDILTVAAAPVEVSRRRRDTWSFRTEVAVTVSGALLTISLAQAS